MNPRNSSPNVLQSELIGLPVKIVASLNPTQVNAEGEVIDETMKTITIRDGANKRVIPKNGTTFRFTLTNGSSAEVQGNHILRRPEDRVKMIPRRAR